MQGKKTCTACGRPRYGQRSCPHCGYIGLEGTDLGICARCGGVFRGDTCIQCGWAGEAVTDLDRLLAHRRDDILDDGALFRLRKSLLRKGAKMGLEEYSGAWYEGDFEGGWIEDISVAIDYAFDQVESGRVKPDNFRNYFRVQAHLRFSELADAALRRQEERESDES